MVPPFFVSWAGDVSFPGRTGRFSGTHGTLPQSMIIKRAARVQIEWIGDALVGRTAAWQG